MIAPPVGPERMFEDDPQDEGAAVVAEAGEALQALCQELNLDEGSAAEALNDFTAIRGNYSLEVSGCRWDCQSDPRQAPPRLRPYSSLWVGGSFPTEEGRRPAGLRGVRNWRDECSSFWLFTYFFFFEGGKVKFGKGAACPRSQVTQVH